MNTSNHGFRSHFAILGLFAANIFAAPLVIDVEALVDLDGKGNGYLLFDEQALAGDPKAGTGGIPLTSYTNGWIKADQHYPLQTIIDLGTLTQLTDVYWFDGAGSDSIYLWCGDGRDWNIISARTTNAYNSWVANTVNCTARYLRVQIRNPNTNILEMVVYGNRIGTQELPPSPKAHTKPTLGDLMGINGFIDDDPTLLAAVEHVREYHSWQWDDSNGDPTTPAYPNNRFAWNPSAVRGTGWGWNFDAYYQDLEDRGMWAAPVFQGTPAWMFGAASGDSLKPMASGADSTNPAVYKAHADYLYQFAARFGRSTVPMAKLRVDALNTPKTGLGTVRSMEGWNEPDKDWKGVTGHFAPTVLAALMSADYDGHQGSMGDSVGIKNADSTMLVVMPALISIDLPYTKALVYWAKMNRAGSFPADALNYHHYCNDAGGQGGTATTGISPEADNLRQRLADLAHYRDRYLPGKQLWLSEFGWDSHAQSAFGAQSFPEASEREVQGRWIVRAYLEIAASGFDRAQLFMLRDTWDNSPGTFATSGLVHDKFDTLMPKYQRKPSWYYVNTLHKQLRNFRYDADISTQGSMRIMRLLHKSAPDSLAYVVWNANDSAAAQNLIVATDINSGVQISLDSTAALGKTSSLTLAAGQVNLTGINGRPILIKGRASGTTGLKTAGDNFALPPQRNMGNRRDLLGRHIRIK